MLSSSGYKTIDGYVKLAHVPDYTLARVLEIATCTGTRIGKKVSNSGETNVVVKATRSHSSMSDMSENQTHLLLLMVFMVGQACLQYCNLDALQCVIVLVEVCRYRSFLPLMTCLRCSLKRSANLRPVSLM